MESFRNVATVWKRVFTKPFYIVIALLVACMFYLLNGLLYNIENVKPLFQSNVSLALKFLLISSLEYIYIVLPFTAVSIIILSVLMGILIALLTYRFKLAQLVAVEKTGWLASVGVFLGAAAPGCAACGIGLLSFLGLAAVFSTLPFHGQEVVVIAILLLLFSVYNISGKIYNPSCQVNFNPNAMKELKGGKNQIGRKKI